MNIEKYETLSQIIKNELGEECKIYPVPQSEEDVQFFDVISEMGALRPSGLLNAIQAALEKGDLQGHAPALINAQPHCMTFEDVDHIFHG